MKKDYITINNHVQVDDLSFVDKFWSERWDMICAWWYKLVRAGRLRFRGMVIRTIARAKHLAVQWDALPETRIQPFFSSFTIRFGIAACKQDSQERLK
jgi:hypothetical protein